MNVAVAKLGTKWVIDPETLIEKNFQALIGKNQRDGWVNINFNKPGNPQTRNQQNFWHKALSLFYRSGLHSFPDYESMRVTFKMRYGVIENAIYIDSDGTIYVRKPYETPPETYREKQISLKSTSQYDRREYSQLIDGTISEMAQSGLLATNKYGEEFQDLLDRRGAFD